MTKQIVMGCRGLAWVSSVAAVAWLTLWLGGCSTSPTVSPLEPVLASSDQHQFSEALKAHGPVRENEVDSLVTEARSGAPPRNVNAARLLAAARGDEARQALTELGAKGKSLEVWVVAVESALLAEELGHGKVDKGLLRADMARSALTQQDARTYRTGLAVGLRLKLAEARQQLYQAMKSEDSDTAALAIANLTPADVRKYESDLLLSLEQADTTTFPTLALALIRTGDGPAQQAVLNSYASKSSSHQAAFLNAAQDIGEPWLVDFLIGRARLGDAFSEEAFGVLVTQVAWEKVPVRREVMKLALERLRRAEKDKRSHKAAEELVTLARQGSNPSKLAPPEDKRLRGAAAIAAGEEWLKKRRRP